MSYEPRIVVPRPGPPRPAWYPQEPLSLPSHDTAWPVGMAGPFLDGGGSGHISKGRAVMWVTTTDGDLVDIRGAWITRQSPTRAQLDFPPPGSFMIWAKFAVGAEYGGTRFAGVLLGRWDRGVDRDSAYDAFAKALREGEPDFDMSKP